MDYLRIYEQLIQKAINLKRSKKTGDYYEQHHIQPRCLGGTNKKSNLVLLTAKEHFIAHKLLCRIYPNQPKLIYAYWMMCSMGNKKQQRYKPSARSYVEAKELMAIVASDKMLGTGRRPCMIKNVYYAGVQVASIVLGISPRTLYNRLASKNPDYRFVDCGEKQNSNYKGRPQAKPVLIDGVEYSSLYAAAKALNTSIPALRYRLSVDGVGGKFKTIHCV